MAVRRAILALGAIGIAVLIFQYIRMAGHIGGDFKIYYVSAQYFRENTDHLYNIDIAISTLTGFLYPPPSIVLFLPFSYLPLATAYAVFFWLIYGCAAAALFVWIRLSDRAIFGDRGLTHMEQAALTAFGLATGPIFAIPVMGQIDTVVLCLAMAYLGLLLSGWHRSAGCVLAVGFWIKLYPGLLLLCALRSRFPLRVWAAFAIAALAIPIATLPVVPEELYRAYFLDMLVPMSKGTIINYYNQSAAAFLMRMSAPIQDMLYTLNVYHIHPAARFGIAAAAAGAAVAILRRPRREPLDEIATFAQLLALIGPVAPLGWGHTYVYMVPLLLLSIMAAVKAASPNTLLVVTVTAACVIVPAYTRFDRTADLSPILVNVVHSRYLLATIFLLACSNHMLELSLARLAKREVVRTVDE